MEALLGAEKEDALRLGVLGRRPCREPQPGTAPVSRAMPQAQQHHSQGGGRHQARAGGLQGSPALCCLAAWVLPALGTVPPACSRAQSGARQQTRLQTRLAAGQRAGGEGDWCWGGARTFSPASP